MNQKKFAVWILVIFLITSCTSLPQPTNEPVSQVNDCPDSEITILGNISAAPGEPISLAVSPANLDRQYQWSASGGSFSSMSESLITFTVPDIEGKFMVSVVGLSNQGCEDVRASKEITVANSPTLTPAATDTVKPTNTPTFTATPTNTPTDEPSPTSTVVPTVAFTNTPVRTPTVVPTSTTNPIAQVILSSPQNGSKISSQNGVFEWSSLPLNTIEGPGGEYYALNIWADGTEVRSISWIKEPRYEIENIGDPIAVFINEINCAGDLGCFWSVDVIISHVAEGDGRFPDSFTTIASSEIRRFFTTDSPNVTPPPPPTPTPTPPPCPPVCG